jgi:hypothetical protein
MQQQPNQAGIVEKFFTDLYTDNRRAGKTIGTKTANGVIRQGIDAEKLIAIDNGALRFQPLASAGWGRQGIAYGPYKRKNGLAFAVFLLNGHNASKPGTGQSLSRRLLRWVLGNETESPQQRMLKWLLSPQKKGMIHRIKCWASNTPQRLQQIESPLIKENLSVGWFPHPVPSNPQIEGNAFVVHGTDAENGELWTRIGSNLLRTFRGLQNLQIYYIVILRETGAAYYIASVPNAKGLTAYPNMRLVAIDPFNRDETVYAGIYQSCLGEVGFRVDTRVYGSCVQKIPEISNWYGTAQAADKLIGNDFLASREAEVGGCWQVYRGNYKLTANGLQPKESNSLAIIYPEQPSGLIHVLIETFDTMTGMSLVWRFQNENNFWNFIIGTDKCQLEIRENGVEQVIATSDEDTLKPNTTNSLQILDDGTTFSVYLNGKLIFNQWFTDSRLANSTGIGFHSITAESDFYLHSWEAHPRVIPIPLQLDLGSPWRATGSEIIITDDFRGDPGELAGRKTTTGDRIWSKDLGTGIIDLTGNGKAKVRASEEVPNPGRTVYTVAWNNPELADLQVDITPPGGKDEQFAVASTNTKSKQSAKSRAGLIFWQDKDNYITINNCLDRDFFCASISSFFHLNGFEEIFDAVWSNVGSQVYWGSSYTLRVVFDGINYTAFVNDEPVLYRSLRDVYPDVQRLAINRVGIVVNWEWGNDTGSIFENFVAKA